MAGEMKRLALVERLIEILGKEHALTLMEHLPPTTWDQLVSKDDLKMTATELRGEFAELRGEFAELRGEFGEHRGELALQLARQTRTIVFTQLGVALSIWIALLVPVLVLSPPRATVVRSRGGNLRLRRTAVLRAGV